MKGNKFIYKIQELKEEQMDVSIRELVVQGRRIFLAYISQITDRESVSSNIIKPILNYNKKEKLNIEMIGRSIIYMDDIQYEKDEEKCIQEVINGKTVIVLDHDERCIIANTVKVKERSVEAPSIETTLRAPRDAFNENMDTNLSLIRYRIKDKNLKVAHFLIGRRTKTEVAVVYIEDIANPMYVGQIKSILEEIDVDGFTGSGQIQKFISGKGQMFPQVGMVERSDTACASILDGKVCIICQGASVGLIAPKTFPEFLDTGEDHYSLTYLTIFLKILRLIALTLTLTLSSIYIVLVGYHPEILPTKYILALATSRVTVPVNAVLEATMMELVSEILREASIRLPKQIGPAIGIVGTIVIGQASVAAGLVSPLMVIIIGLSSMASFALPDYTMVNAMKIPKFILLIFSSIFGIFGFLMGYTMIMINLVSISSYGIPYMAPLAPFNFEDVKDFLLSNIVSNDKRPNFLRVKDKKRKN